MNRTKMGRVARDNIHGKSIMLAAICQVGWKVYNRKCKVFGKLLYYHLVAGFVVVHWNWMIFWPDSLENSVKSRDFPVYRKFDVITQHILCYHRHYLYLCMHTFTLFLIFEFFFDTLGLLPKSALTVEEEAWNAYPYSECIFLFYFGLLFEIFAPISLSFFFCFLLAAKTRYTCPFVEKFSLEIETYYYPDDGHQENVFNLDGSDLRNRIVGKFIWRKCRVIWTFLSFTHVIVSNTIYF